MPSPADLLANNRAWASAIVRDRPDFFTALAEQQRPNYLWIGCSDSRVPPSEIVGAMPGELFVHRNIANVVVHSDLNCLSVLQYAVEALRVEHVVVCGHYGCGGVAAACDGRPLGLIDNWLRHVQDAVAEQRSTVEQIPDPGTRLRRLCELNALAQAQNVCRTSIVQDAWRRGQSLTVHGWIYDIADGLVRDLGFRATAPGEVGPSYAAAVQGVVAHAAHAESAA